MKKIEVPLDCIPYDIQDEDENIMELSMDYFNLEGMDEIYVLKMNQEWTEWMGDIMADK